MLSKNIKTLRIKQNLTQEALAQKSGITYSTLIKLESGFNKNPKIDTLQKIVKVLKVKIDDLIKE